ncbi:hypothetical protein K3495_g9866 [Podosphaera aphanis]|nr:hypothetical protein K3495_g9866 [Podosphaera aphanis]
MFRRFHLDLHQQAINFMSTDPDYSTAWKRFHFYDNELRISRESRARRRQPTAFTTQTSFPIKTASTSFGIGTDTNNRKCYNCRKFGHTSRDYPQPQKPSKTVSSLQQMEGENSILDDMMEECKVDEADAYDESENEKPLSKSPLEDTKMTSSPVYHQMPEELQVVTQYRIDHVHQGWNEPSPALFSAPIVLIQTSCGGLRVCADARTRNVLPKSDPDPLPLIDETWAGRNRAKVVTKRDLRPAWHRIRMEAEAEERTTVRTCYGESKCKILPGASTI